MECTPRAGFAHQHCRHQVWLKVSGQSVGADPPGWPCEFWDSNSGCEACWQALLPAISPTSVTCWAILPTSVTFQAKWLSAWHTVYWCLTEGTARRQWHLPARWRGVEFLPWVSRQLIFSGVQSFCTRARQPFLAASNRAASPLSRSWISVSPSLTRSRGVFPSLFFLVGSAPCCKDKNRMVHLCLQVGR